MNRSEGQVIPEMVSSPVHAARSFLMIVACCVLVACAGRGHVEIPPDPAALAQVHAIYLGDFGTEDGADLVREKVRERLMTSKRFAVVESADKADAILTGSAGVEETARRGTTGFAGTGLLRLVDARSQKTIWAHEYRRGFMFGGSVSTRVANQMVDQLLADAKPHG